MARSFIEANTQRLIGNFANVVHPITLGCWFYDTSGTDNDRNLIQIFDSSASNKLYRLSREGVGNRIRVSDNWGTFNDAQTTTYYTTNTWNHALGVIKSNTSRTAYLNGGGASTTTASSGVTPTGIDTISIGYEADTTPADPWAGYIAEVGVWNVELNAGEIASLAAGYSPLLIRRGSLIFYAPLVRGLSNGDDNAIAGINSGLLVSTTSSGQVGVSNHPRIIQPSAQILQFPPAAAAGGANPKGPLGMPFYGPFGGPI